MEYELNFLLHDVQSKSYKLIKNLEYLRFTNSLFRKFVNTELKNIVKKQLFRNKDELWHKFFMENKNLLNSMKSYSEDNYIDTKNREQFYTRM